MAELWEGAAIRETVVYGKEAKRGKRERERRSLHQSTQNVHSPEACDNMHRQVSDHDRFTAPRQRPGMTRHLSLSMVVFKKLI